MGLSARPARSPRPAFPQLLTWPGALPRGPLSSAHLFLRPFPHLHLCPGPSPQSHLSKAEQAPAFPSPPGHNPPPCHSVCLERLHDRSRELNLAGWTAPPSGGLSAHRRTPGCSAGKRHVRSPVSPDIRGRPPGAVLSTRHAQNNRPCPGSFVHCRNCTQAVTL